MNRKRIALILLGLVLLASLLACGFSGVKMVRRMKQRHAAMTAYENRDYEQAEPLLLEYVRKNPDAEAEYAALANIYHEVGNSGMEAQMWQTASSLNPQNPEYRENMVASAVRSASYPLLHGILGRKAKIDAALTDRELYLYVISSYRSGYPQDGDDAYRKAVKADPEAFHKNELGRIAEFMAVYSKLNEGERKDFMDNAIRSDDPAARFEAIYIAVRRMEQRDDDGSQIDEEMERLLKLAAEANYSAGTALLADFYFSRERFQEAIDVLEPYLNALDDMNLYLLYAESCVFEGKLDELKTLGKKLRRKSGTLQFMADYCEVLTAYLENDEAKLAAAVRKSAKRINSPLSRLIRLRVAMANESFDEIRTVAHEIFSNPPFHDLHNRALLVCLDYIANEMKKPANQKDPSRMAGLARILSGYLHGNQMLTEITMMDQYKKDLVKESDLLNAIEQFPDDALLLRIAAEDLVYRGKAEQALPIIEQVMSLEKRTGRQSAPGNRMLLMLALDQTGRHDEAAEVFRELLEQSAFEPELLARYFQFCINDRRAADLADMAVKLDSSDNRDMARYRDFFRAAAMLATGDGEKENEALDLLAATPTDDPEFTFYAAARLCEHDRLDEAEVKYNAILKTYRTPSLILMNLSELYHAKGDAQKALETAKEAFALVGGVNRYEKESMLPAFIYAKRLSEAERWQEAVDVLKFPRHAVNYRGDVIELWCDCMRHVIEKSFADRRFLLAEEQCKHLLMIAPDDKFGLETMEKVREILNPKKDDETQNGKPGVGASAAPAA